MSYKITMISTLLPLHVMDRRKVSERLTLIVTDRLHTAAGFCFQLERISFKR